MKIKPRTVSEVLVGKGFATLTLDIAQHEPTGCKRAIAVTRWLFVDSLFGLMNTKRGERERETRLTFDRDTDKAEAVDARRCAEGADHEFGCRGTGRLGALGQPVQPGLHAGHHCLRLDSVAAAGRQRRALGQQQGDGGGRRVAVAVAVVAVAGGAAQGRAAHDRHREAPLLPHLARARGAAAVHPGACCACCACCPCCCWLCCRCGWRGGLRHILDPKKLKKKYRDQVSPSGSRSRGRCPIRMHIRPSV